VLCQISINAKDSLIAAGKFRRPDSYRDSSDDVTARKNDEARLRQAGSL